MNVYRLIFATVLLFSAQVFSQDAESVQQQLGQMVERLGLTSEQVTQIKPVITSSMKRSADILKEHELDMSSLQNMANGDISLMEAKNVGSALNAIREETTKQLEDFLTPEQMSEFTKLLLMEATSLVIQ